MANRGQLETARLRQNAEEQVARLMTQLEDLDALRDVRLLVPAVLLQLVTPCVSAHKGLGAWRV
jgi:hypothetical protein